MTRQVVRSIQSIGIVTGGSGLAGYKIYRGPSFINTTTSTSYSDTGLASTALYSYTVYAYDNANNTSLVSNTASATTLTPVVASLNATTWVWKLRGSNQTIDPPRVCTGSGGSGTGFTYQWLWVSGDTQTGVNNPLSNTTDWSRSVPLNVSGNYTSIWRCVATDSLGNTGEKTITVSFIRNVL